MYEDLVECTAGWMHHILAVLIVSLQLGWKLIFIVLSVQLSWKEWAKLALCILVIKKLWN